jgi:hypothetical protein
VDFGVLPALLEQAAGVTHEPVVGMGVGAGRGPRRPSPSGPRGRPSIAVGNLVNAAVRAIVCFRPEEMAGRLVVPCRSRRRSSSGP